MSKLERREVLAALVAAGWTPSSLAGAAQARSTITPEILDRAQALLDHELDPDRLDEILPSVQRNLDFFQIVRDLEIDDPVEPAPIFRARREGE